MPQSPEASHDLKRRRAASIGGFARAQQESAQDARQRGGETRGAQLAGNSSWGQRLAELKRLKRNGPPPSLEIRVRELESQRRVLEERLGRLEALLESAAP